MPGPRMADAAAPSAAAKAAARNPASIADEIALDSRRVDVEPAPHQRKDGVDDAPVERRHEGPDAHREEHPPFHDPPTRCDPGLPFGRSTKFAIGDVPHTLVTKLCLPSRILEERRRSARKKGVNVLSKIAAIYLGSVLLAATSPAAQKTEKRSTREVI